MEVVIVSIVLMIMMATPVPVLVAHELIQDQEMLSNKQLEAVRHNT